jgi:3-methyladenine DNA glycosylase AlkC
MLLKDLYSPMFYTNFGDVLQKFLPDFDKKKFNKQIFSKDWNDKELKDRMWHTTRVLNEHLPSDFKKTAKIIKNLVTELQRRPITGSGLEFMFLPDYIEKYGIHDFETSVNLFEHVTPFTSCEFAVRPFVIKYEMKMLERMLDWSTHKNHHVRRLASEGARPRLPWAMALPALKKNPSSILPILENLKADESEYVRRSVANNLNDIAKDNPHVVIEIAKKWKGLSKETDAIIKHGARTLLKQGNADILKHFGLQNNTKVEVHQFNIVNKKIKIGDYLEFDFLLRNSDKKAQELRLEYAIHYLRNNGTHAKKVFKISERTIDPMEEIKIKRKQSFKLITTRQFYIGKQYVSVIVNGNERAKEEFWLKENSKDR